VWPGGGFCGFFRPRRLIRPGVEDREMLEALVILVIGGSLFFLVVFSLRRRSAPPLRPPTFVCPHCGEKHCDCHPEKQPGERTS
jgi:hypothetical protein